MHADNSIKQGPSLHLRYLTLTLRRPRRGIGRIEEDKHLVYVRYGIKALWRVLVTLCFGARVLRGPDVE